MIEKGADINIEDKYGPNCIFYSVREGHYEMTQLLIENGANLNQIDKKKMTPLTFAEKNGQTRIEELLIKNGAVKPESKQSGDKKNKKNSNKGNNNTSSVGNEQNSELTIGEIQKPKKFLLVKIDEEGRKIQLTEEEIQEFKKMHSEIFKYLENKEELQKLTNNANKELLFYDCWEKQAKRLMNSLWKVKDAELFHKPVDPEELKIPNYFKIITHPMDFSTIKRKLNNNSYTNCKEFCDDLNLTFTNCYTYNGEQSYVGQICSNIENEYKKLYQQYGIQKFL
jgi:hypothetical protein